MAEQATLEILVKEGSGATLTGRGPQPVPLAPSSPSSDWIQRLSESVKGPTIGRPGQLQTPPTEVVWKKGFEPPPVRGPGTVPQGPIIPDPQVFQKGLQGPVDSLKKTLGGAELPFANFTSGLGKLGLATAGAAIAVGAFQKVFATWADYQLRTFKTQTAMRVASLEGNYIQEQIAKTMQPNLWNYVPVAKQFRETFQEFQKAALEREGQLRQSLFGVAQRLAPVSGPIAAGQAQAEAIRLRGQITEAQIAGPALGNFLRAQAREQAAMDRLNADNKRREAELKARDLDNRAVLAEIAASSKDANQRARIREALEDQQRGNFSEFNKLLRETRDEIKKLRAAQEKEFLDKPLSWFDDIVNGERGRPNFQGVPTDLVRETMRQQISPAF